MLAAYRPLFAVPGATRFVAGAALSRVGGAMFGVAEIVMVSARRDSYALAGAIASVAVVVLAVSAPVIGGLVDRYGQRRVSLPFVLVAAVSGFVTAFLSWRMAPVWTLFLFYGLSALLPESGPMSRARWAHIFRDEPDRLHTAMSFEQVTEELSFVVGPVLAVFVSTLWFPEAGLVLAEILFTLGMVLFLSARSTEPPVVPHHHRPGGLAIHRPGMLLLPAVLAMVGVIFGANEVVAVAVAEHAGQKPFSGVILGLFALGSALSGLLMGTMQFRISLTTRLLVAAAGMFLLEAPALAVTHLWGLAAIMFVAGSATAPMLITALSLVQKIVPTALLTEGMAVAVTGILVGMSIGTSASGWAVEHLGAHAAYVVPVGAGGIAVLLALVGYRRLLGAERAGA